MQIDVYIILKLSKSSAHFHKFIHAPTNKTANKRMYVFNCPAWGPLIIIKLLFFSFEIGLMSFLQILHLCVSQMKRMGLNAT